MDPSNEVLALCTAIGVVGCAILLIVKGTRWVFSTLRKFNDLLDDWRGEGARPGHAHQPGVPERLFMMEQRLIKVEQDVNRVSAQINNSSP